MTIRYRVTCAGCGETATSGQYVGPDMYLLCPRCEDKARDAAAQN